MRPIILASFLNHVRTRSHVRFWKSEGTRTIDAFELVITTLCDDDWDETLDDETDELLVELRLDNELLDELLRGVGALPRGVYPSCESFAYIRPL